MEAATLWHQNQQQQKKTLKQEKQFCQQTFKLIITRIKSAIDRTDARVKSTPTDSFFMSLSDCFDVLQYLRVIWVHFITSRAKKCSRNNRLRVSFDQTPSKSAEGGKKLNGNLTVSLTILITFNDVQRFNRALHLSLINTGNDRRCCRIFMSFISSHLARLTQSGAAGKLFLPLRTGSH